MSYRSRQAGLRPVTEFDTRTIDSLKDDLTSYCRGNDTSRKDSYPLKVSGLRKISASLTVLKVALDSKNLSVNTFARFQLLSAILTGPEMNALTGTSKFTGRQNNGTNVVSKFFNKAVNKAAEEVGHEGFQGRYHQIYNAAMGAQLFKIQAPLTEYIEHYGKREKSAQACFKFTYDMQSWIDEQSSNTPQEDGNADIHWLQRVKLVYLKILTFVRKFLDFFASCLPSETLSAKVTEARNMLSAVNRYAGGYCDYTPENTSAIRQGELGQIFNKIPKDESTAAPAAPGL